MTEDEAKKKWCPLTRMALMGGMAANRTSVMHPEGEGYANIYAETRCIASGCMMWVPWSGNPQPPGEYVSHGDCGLKSFIRT